MTPVAKRTAVVEECPDCSTKARRVAPLTVRSLVKPELAGTVREEPYRFCESPECDVVYFGETHPEHRFFRADLRVRVGQKATEPPIQVCYCFDWTTDDIEREFRLTGTTTIPDRIKEKIQQGFCHCETMNPQGTCCLGNVNKGVREISTRLAVPSEAAAVSHVEVDYARSEAMVTTDKCCSPSHDPLIRAVRDAGYDAQVKK